MYLTTTTTITAPSLCRINIKNNVLDTSLPDDYSLLCVGFFKETVKIEEPQGNFTDKASTCGRLNCFNNLCF